MTKQDKFNNKCKAVGLLLIAVFLLILYVKDWTSCCCCCCGTKHAPPHVITQPLAGKPSGTVQVIEIPPDYISLFPVKPTEYRYDDLLLPRTTGRYLWPRDEHKIYYPLMDSKLIHIDAPKLFNFSGEGR